MVAHAVLGFLRLLFQPSTWMKPPLWLSLPLAGAFAFGAWQARWLTRNGALATFVVGFIVFGLAGGKFIVPLLVFFLSSSLLSRLGDPRRKQRILAKGATRDAGQVWANGGMAAALALAFALCAPSQPIVESRLLMMLFLAALASVNADTWATEIGGLARSAPRLLTNWKPVASGTSGAITGLGLLASLGGALVIPLSAWGVWNLNAAEIVSVAWAGFLGSLADSILGASVQAQYRDPVTGELTERTELAGRKMVCVRGLRWVNNDVVNFLASVIGVCCAWALLHYGVYAFR